MKFVTTIAKFNANTTWNNLSFDAVCPCHCSLMITNAYIESPLHNYRKKKHVQTHTLSSEVHGTMIIKLREVRLVVALELTLLAILRSFSIKAVADKILSVCPCAI